MAKFKKGDRVVNLQKNDIYIPHLAKGVVAENGSEVPYVIWDRVNAIAGKGNKRPQTEDRLKLLRQPQTPTIEIYKSRGQFTFRVKGANGKKLNHLFDSKQGCKNGILALKKALENYKIVDLTK